MSPHWPLGIHVHDHFQIQYEINSVDREKFLWGTNSNIRNIVFTCRSFDIHVSFFFKPLAVKPPIKSGDWMVPIKNEK